MGKSRLEERRPDMAGGAGRWANFRLNQDCQKQDDKQPERTGEDKFANYFIPQAHVIYIGIKFKNFRTLSARDGF
jgi:hypothetical protein